jgi:hypothetical protein
MQLLRTDIRHAIAPTGEPVLRVIFCGEGGDCVTVDMATVEAGGERGIIDRAKAILVQTATFDLAQNKYDAASNGDYDEVAVTAAHDHYGDVYLFEYRGGEFRTHVPPSRLPSFEAAREEAVRCAVELLADRMHSMDERTGWLVRVRDENGGLLFAIDVQEAETARRAHQ